MWIARPGQSGPFDAINGVTLSIPGTLFLPGGAAAPFPHSAPDPAAAATLRQCAAAAWGNVRAYITPAEKLDPIVSWVFASVPECSRRLLSSAARAGTEAVLFRHFPDPPPADSRKRLSAAWSIDDMALTHLLTPDNFARRKLSVTYLRVVSFSWRPSAARATACRALTSQRLGALLPGSASFRRPRKRHRALLRHPWRFI